MKIQLSVNAELALHSILLFTKVGENDFLMSLVDELYEVEDIKLSKYIN